jgi:hypothetical protein
MKNLSFLAFITIILFTECTDPEGILKIGGKILDENTKVAIPRRAVIVQALVKRDNDFIPVYAGQFLTDSSGHFEYTLKKVRNSYLYNFCFVGDSVYAFTTIKLGLTELNRDDKFLTFCLNKLTDLTITIDRKSKKPALDTLYLSWESNGVDGKFLYPYKIENYGLAQNQGFVWIGGNIKSEIKTKTYADRMTIVCWKLYRNGKRKEIIDTVFCRRDVINNVNFKY